MLRIQLLGEFSLAYDDQPVTGVNTPRLQSLLAYLVLHRQAPQPRRRLAFLFWPDSSEAQAHTNLRKLFHQLHRALPDADRFLDADSHTLQWRPASPFSLDVADFETAIGPTASTATLRDAVALYRGDLLPDCYDDWARPERERLRDAFIEALERLIALLESEGDYRVAISYAQRLLRHDPLLETAYRRLIRLHALTGDRTGVARVYHTCAAVLRRELDVEPGLETQRAYARGLQMAAAAPPVPEPTPAARPDRGRNNLPRPLTRFIGREREKGEVRQLVLTHRLVTLTGPGGIGKTRLALAVADELLDAFADGVWHVDLAALSDPALVAPAAAAVLAVREEGGQPLLARLTAYLREKHLLLILDNCEHLVEAVRPLAETLLQAAADVRILAASRRALGAAGEVTWRVPPLSAPDMSRWAALDRPGGAEAPPDLALALRPYESVAVLADRAAAVLPTFAVTNENAWAVGQICQQLDGLPLALELAAARISLLTPQQIVDHLQDALRLLTQGRPTALPRHQTLQATLDWSHALLTPDEQVLFRRLAAFAGSFTLEAAESVGGGEGLERARVLDALAGLVDKSLVSVEPAGAVTRFRLHETTRQYARVRLAEAGEEAPVRNRHLDFFCRLAESLEASLLGAMPPGALGRLTQEYDNLRAALEWSTHAPGDAQAGLRLAAALPDFWEARGQVAAERGWLEELLGRAGATAEPDLRAKSLRGAGKVAYYQGDFAAARSFFEQSAALDRELDNRPRLADTLGRLGLLEFLLGRQPGYAAVHPFYQESLAIFRALGDGSGVARIQSELGYIASCQGDYARARSCLEESLALFREPDDQYLAARARHLLGNVARLEGDYAQTRSLYAQAITVLHGLGNAWGVFYVLEAFGHLALAEGQPARATRLFGAVERLGETIGTALVPPDQAAHERGVAAARAALGEPAFAAAWAAGRAMTLDEAIADALAR